MRAIAAKRAALEAGLARDGAKAAGRAASE
jgi:hypothetical protein